MKQLKLKGIDDMSVMIVKGETYVKLVNSIYLHGENWIIDHALNGMDFEAVCNEFKKMHWAVKESYNRRYRESGYRELKISDKDYSRFDNPCQILKSLECIKYQIELDEKEFDFIFLNKMIETYKTVIIEGLDEYKEAQWG